MMSEHIIWEKENEKNKKISVREILRKESSTAEGTDKKE
jgi:hypothetical protein